jgi:hypothetical protein
VTDPIAAQAERADLPAYGEDERGTGNALEHLIRTRLFAAAAETPLTGRSNLEHT